MARIELHPELFPDIQRGKKIFRSLGKQIHGLCRLLIQEGHLPGKAPYHYLKDPILSAKLFHAGINFPEENASKTNGGRIFYVKEDNEMIKIIHICAGHKDKRYNDSPYMVELIKIRYATDSYLPYSENLDFDI